MSFKDKTSEYYRLFKQINILSLSDLTDKLAEGSCYNKKILNIYTSILLISFLPDFYIMIAEQTLNLKSVVPLLCLLYVMKTDSKFSYDLNISFYRAVCLYTAVRIKSIIISVIIILGLDLSGMDEFFDDSKEEMINLMIFAFVFFGYLLVYGINMQIKLKRNGSLSLTWGRGILTVFLGLACIFFMLIYAFFVISEFDRYHQIDKIIYPFLVLLFAELCAYYFRKRRKLAP